MTDTEFKLISLAKELEAVKDKLKGLYEDLEPVLAELGEGTYVQDLNDSVVYKVQKPKGTFTYYRDLDFIRTKRADEPRGGMVLSKKEATEAGYTL